MYPVSPSVSVKVAMVPSGNFIVPLESSVNKISASYADTIESVECKQGQGY